MGIAHFSGKCRGAFTAGNPETTRSQPRGGGGASCACRECGECDGGEATPRAPARSSYGGSIRAGCWCTEAAISYGCRRDGQCCATSEESYVRTAQGCTASDSGSPHCRRHAGAKSSWFHDSAICANDAINSNQRRFRHAHGCLHEQHSWSDEYACRLNFLRLSRFLFFRIICNAF